ncbi:MAG: hypothetical protein QXF21_03220 [Thermoproteota archaeon]
MPLENKNVKKLRSIKKIEVTIRLNFLLWLKIPSIMKSGKRSSM